MNGLELISSVHYDTAQPIGETNYLTEVGPALHARLSRNLGAGLESVGSLEAFPTQSIQVRQFNERDCRSLPAFIENQNAPKIERQNYVYGGVGDLKSGQRKSSRSFHHRQRPGQVPTVFITGSPAVSLSPRHGSLLLPKEKGQGMACDARKNIRIYRFDLNRAKP